MKTYIAVIGKMGSGKETVFRTIRDLDKLGFGYSASIHHFSDPLNEILDLLFLPRVRANQQSLSTLLRQRFGEELLGSVLQKRAELDKADMVVLDGVRRPQDVVMFRRLLNSFLVLVIADPEIRWQRLRRRADRPGDAEKTWEQFQKEDVAETESRIEEIGKQADYIIDNSGSFENLQSQVRKFLTEKIGLVL